MKDPIGYSQQNKFQKSPLVNIFALVSCTSIVVYYVFFKPEEKENCFTPLRTYVRRMAERCKT